MQTASASPLIQFGANFRVVGKCEPDKLSYSGAWQEQQGNFAELAAHIGAGHPWMPSLLDEGKRRRQENANYAELISLDIDSGMSIEDALSHPLISKHCSLGIESSGSRIFDAKKNPDSHDKFRLVFRLPEALTDWQSIKTCNEYLQMLIGTADRACKDASRFFFGAVGRKPFLLNESATLPESFISDALQWKAKLEAEVERRYQESLARRAQYEGDDDKESLVIEALKFIPAREPGSGNYSDCLTVLMALVHEFGEAKAQQIAESWSPSIPGNTWQIDKKIASLRNQPARPVTIGSLFYIAKQHGFKFPRRDSLSEILKGMKRGQGCKRPKPDGFAPKAEPKPAETATTANEYPQGTRSQTWQKAGKTHKFVLDSSATGDGKSHTTGLQQPEDFGAKQLIYISADYRNATNQHLGEWDTVEGRHRGLKREKKTNRLRRISKGDAYAVPPNCSRTAAIAALRSKNITDADSAKLPCKTCPLYEMCCHSQGNGYGFINQRVEGLKQPRIRMHPASLPSPTDFDYSSVQLFWDEVSQLWQSNKTITVTASDVEQTICALLRHPENKDVKALVDFLLELLSYLGGRTPLPPDKRRYGLSHRPLIEVLPAVPADINIPAIAAILNPDLSDLDPTAEYGVPMEDLPRDMRKRFADKDGAIADKLNNSLLLQWLPQMLQILQGGNGYLHLQKKQLTIAYPDERLQAIARAAKGNIFLDATHQPQDLSLSLGCDAEEIHHIEQQATPPDNLEIIQVADLGRMSKQRGNDQQRRAEAIIKHFRALDPTTKVIDFKVNEQDGAWFRDSRGVNNFTDSNTLILVGTPCPNLAALLAEYSCLTSAIADEDDPQFKGWVDRQIRAEILQGIGRLRANRRPGQQLRVVILSNFDLGEDIPVKQIAAKDICPSADTKVERTKADIRRAVDWLKQQGLKITQAAISRVTGLSQGYISRFRELLQTLLDPPYSKSNNANPPPDELAPLVKVATAALDGTSQECLSALSEFFFEWVDRAHWRDFWELLPNDTQDKAISALSLCLPPKELEAVV